MARAAAGTREPTSGAAPPASIVVRVECRHRRPTQRDAVQGTDGKIRLIAATHVAPGGRKPTMSTVRSGRGFERADEVELETGL